MRLSKRRGPEPQRLEVREKNPETAIFEIIPFPKVVIPAHAGHEGEARLMEEIEDLLN